MQCWRRNVDSNLFILNVLLIRLFEENSSETKRFTATILLQQCLEVVLVLVLVSIVLQASPNQMAGITQNVIFEVLLV